MIICTELNEIELSLWDLNCYIALKELKCVIYDGLEIKLKVTKMFVWNNYLPSTGWWWWWMICPVSCVFLISNAGSLKESKKLLKLYCHVLCVLFLLWMVLKWVHSLNVMYESQGSCKETEIHCVEWSWKNQFLEGSLPWRFNTVNLKGVSHGEWKHYVIQCRGLERSQSEQFLCCIWT